MTLDPSIFIFANTYNCPLDKRCNNCVFDNLIKVDKREIYQKIVDMDCESKSSLVDACERCQEEYALFNS